MYSKILKNILIPSSPVMLLSATVVTNTEVSPAKTEEKKIRRTDLPIYPKEECEHCKKSPLVLKEEPNIFIQGISTIRKEIEAVLGQSEDFVNKTNHIFNTGVAHTMAQIEYLRDEENLVPRVGAIAGSTLFGYILAIRKGFFKKMFYMTAGGVLMASLCYPEDSKIYREELFAESKKYALVGYHFLNGVSKDVLGYELPEIPKPISQDDAKPTSDKPSIKSLLPSFTLPSPPLDVPKSAKQDK